jgi:hypothetical protein
LIVAFLTSEEENRFKEYISRQLDPFVGLITTRSERAEFRAERVRYATVRSCTVTNSFGFSLGPDSAILLEDHHQIIETADIGTVSYTVPLAYIISYGDSIDCMTVEGLLAYSTSMWREGMLSAYTKPVADLSQLQRTRN